MRHALLSPNPDPYLLAPGFGANGVETATTEDVMMRVKTLVSAIGVALGLAVASGQASAYATYSFEDDDVDAILDPQTLLPRTSGLLTPGDIFLSVLEVPVFTINGANAIPTGQEMTGVAAVQLQAIIGAGVGAQYIFAPYTGGLNSILALGGAANVGASGDAGGGAMIALFLNGTSGQGPNPDIDLDLNRTTNPATNCPTVAFCIDQGSRGDLFQVDGFTGLDNDEFWFATQLVPGGNDIGQVAGANNNLLVSAYNLGLGTFFNAWGPVGFINIQTGLPCVNQSYQNGDGCVQFSASGTITGGQGLNNGFIAHSDFDGQKLVETPEPGTLALMSLGLLGLAAGSLRRKS